MSDLQWPCSSHRRTMDERLPTGRKYIERMDRRLPKVDRSCKLQAVAPRPRLRRAHPGSVPLEHLECLRMREDHDLGGCKHETLLSDPARSFGFVQSSRSLWGRRSRARRVPQRSYPVAYEGC